MKTYTGKTNSIYREYVSEKGELLLEPTGKKEKRQ